MDAMELPANDPKHYVVSIRDQTTKVTVAYRLSLIRCEPSYLQNYSGRLPVLSCEWSANLSFTEGFFNTSR